MKALVLTPLITSLVFLWASSFPTAKAHGNHNHTENPTCGTPDYGPATMQRIMDIAKRKKKARGGVGRVLQSTTNITIIDTYICVVTDAAGNGDVANSILQQQINVININFANNSMPFQFQVKGIQRYVQPAATTTFLQYYLNAVAAACHQGGMDVLNIYVVPNIYTETTSTGSYLTVGVTYPFFLTGNSYMDGVYLLNACLPGGSNQYDNLGITGVHEVGHWFGLIHVFQSTGTYVNDPCNLANPQDYISDTPQMASASSGCPVGRDSCPADAGLDPIHNYMDYSFDSDGHGHQCRTVFTPLQVARMEDIWYYYRVQNLICATTEIQFNLNIKFDSSPQTLSWDIKLPNGTLVHSSISDQFGGAYATNFAGQTITLNRCLAQQVYIFDIYDSDGNGIASPGYYQLEVNGVVVAKGGQDFKTSKSVRFGSTSPSTLAPSRKPTNHPTSPPTRKPTNHPTSPATLKPTTHPTTPPTTRKPTTPPLLPPTPAPTRAPTPPPSKPPTLPPTPPPSLTLTPPPSSNPTSPPTSLPPTLAPTLAPSPISPVTSPPSPPPVPSTLAPSPPPTLTDPTSIPTTTTPTTAPLTLAPTFPTLLANRTAVVIKIPAGYCFSHTNTVEVEHRGIISMKELQIGDMVKDASGNMVRVYSFGHYHTTVKTEYLQIHAHELVRPLEISKDHLVFVYGGTAIPASLVSIGDQLDVGTKQGFATVIKIKRVIRSGAYAPFTMSGTILVNGVAASSYVSLQQDSHVLVLGTEFKTPLSMHWLAHVFQAPHRLICLMMGRETCQTTTYTNEGISKWVDTPLQFFQWLLRQPAIIMFVVLVPCLLLALMIYALEVVLMGSWCTYDGGVILFVMVGIIVTSMFTMRIRKHVAVIKQLS